MADGVDGNVQKIGFLASIGKIWKPLSFKVIYKFPKQPAGAVNKKHLIKCIIADDSGLVTLLMRSDDEDSYKIFNVGSFYTIMAGGCACREAHITFKPLCVHNNNLELWVSDPTKIVAEPSDPTALIATARSHFNFTFTELSKLAKGNFDILAKVVWEGIEEIGTNSVPFKRILLLDKSVGVNQAIKCRLQGDHCNLALGQGTNTILALFNAFVGSEGKDLVIYVNYSSAAFPVSSIEWEWILSEEQSELKSSILNVESSMMWDGNMYSDEENQDISGGKDRSQRQRWPVTPPKRQKLESADGSIGSPSGSSIRVSSSTNIISTSPNKRRVDCSSIAEFKGVLKERDGRLDITLVGVYALPDFLIRRYLGCARCSKSLTVLPNGDYVCHGKICSDSTTNNYHYRNESNQRKSFYLLKHFKIKDDQDELTDNLIGYNQVVQDVLNKEADEFESDSSILETFTSLMKDHRLDIFIKAFKSGSNSWNLTIEKLSVSSSDEDAVLGYPLLSIPEIPEVKPVSNAEDDIRDFLDNRTEFEVSVVRSTQQPYPPNEEDEYINSKTPPRGIALHISITANRKGWEADQRTFDELFKQLHYEVRTIKDAKSYELAQHIIECREDLVKRKFESFVLCISGHGLNNTILLADEKQVNVWTDIIYQFDDSNFPQFRGKPKIILVNACQTFATKEHMEALPFTSPATTAPNHPDFLVFIATSPGFEAYRNPAFGTHFIRTLACVLMWHAHHMEIKKLFYLVSKILHHPDKTGRRKRQLPEIRDFIFSKAFYFRP